MFDVGRHFLCNFRIGLGMLAGRVGRRNRLSSVRSLSDLDIEGDSAQKLNLIFVRRQLGATIMEDVTGFAAVRADKVAHIFDYTENGN